MYFHKSPQFIEEFVEFIRISKKFFEKIFLIEIKIYDLCGKLPTAKNIYEGIGNEKPYHKDLEISKILKLFLANLKILKIYKNLDNSIKKKQFSEFLAFVITSRNLIAHNKLKKINIEWFLGQLKVFQEILKISEDTYSLNINKRYLQFLKKSETSLREKINDDINDYFFNKFIEFHAENLQSNK